jgi:ubiquinol-cytochrome c reductase cytochrome c1 subunit
MKNILPMKRFLLALIACVGLAATPAFASEGGEVHWDKAPNAINDLTSLQNGAKLFVNYCLNCHSAAYMRYNRLGDLGLTETQIKQSLMFGSEKVGDTMKVALDPVQAKAWFGGVPPDLTVIARSRSGPQGTGADYIYTYLRSYYRDDTRPTGWNNLAFPNVGMPHVLWELQGQRAARFVERKDPHDPEKTVHVQDGFEQIAPGKLSPLAYDDAVGDLVAFLQWMGEPSQQARVRIGVWVLLFLAGFIVIAWRLNAAYWKDVK